MGPPQRQVEFRIDLVPGATPVAKSPYRLAPSEMQELSYNYQELQRKVSYGSSQFPWGQHSVVFIRRGSMGNSFENPQADGQKWKHDSDFGRYNEGVSPVLWAEIGESSLIGPELVQETTDKVVLIKEKLKAARDRQKSYADNRRKPLEFEVGDRVMLKVSPWKGVIRFGKKGKLAPRYVGPFEILERVGPVAYRLRLPEELSGIKVDKTLRFVEEPVENSDREVKRLKCSRMVVVKAKWLAVRYLVKVSWNSKYNFELTWVWEDYLKDKFGNQSIERDRLIGIGFVLDFVEFISFTFGDKEMILWFKRFSDLSCELNGAKIERSG
ncbi:hypothetical protein Tco_0825270 [Tanacetum coccineum]